MRVQLKVPYESLDPLNRGLDVPASQTAEETDDLAETLGSLALEVELTLLVDAVGVELLEGTLKL